MAEKMQVEEGEVDAESRYVRKTNKEIKDLAFGVRSGNIFGSWMLRESEFQHLTLIFMPLIAFSDIDHKRLARDGIQHFYGDMNDSAPRSINGLPIFFTIGLLNAEDCARITVELKRLEDFLKEGEED